MDNSQFHAFFGLSVVRTLVGMDQMAIIYLSKFLIVQILNEEINHLGI